MILFEQGLEYWRVAKRFHEHRQFQGMRPVAVNDMCGLARRTTSKAVRKRIDAFIVKHSSAPVEPPPKRTA